MAAVIQRSGQAQLRRRNTRLALAVGALAVAFYVALYVVYLTATQ